MIVAVEEVSVTRCHLTSESLYIVKSRFGDRNVSNQSQRRIHELRWRVNFNHKTRLSWKEAIEHSKVENPLMEVSESALPQSLA